MKYNNETKLGVIVTICILIIVLLVTFLGKLEFSEEGYTIKARFTFIGDLKVGAPVIFAGGIRVGKVIDIVPYKDQVEVIIKIKKTFKIKAGNEIVVYTQGLLGEKYIEIHGYEGEGEYLKSGAIVNGTDPVSFDAMSIRLSKLIKGVFGPTLTDEEVKKSFANLFNNAGLFAYNLNMLIQENRKNIYFTINNLQSLAQALDKNLTAVLVEIKGLSHDIGEISRENQKSIGITINNLEQTSKHLTLTMQELQKTSVNLDNITGAVKGQKGTVGKMIYDRELYDILKRTSDNLEKFSDIVKRNPKSLMWGK